MRGCRDTWLELAHGSLGAPERQQPSLLTLLLFLQAVQSVYITAAMYGGVPLYRKMAACEVNG